MEIELFLKAKKKTLAIFFFSCIIPKTKNLSLMSTAQIVSVEVLSLKLKHYAGLSADLWKHLHTCK